MSTETLSVLVGGPGLVALVVAVIGFLQNRRTLSASQPKSEAERMAIDINSLAGDTSAASRERVVQQLLAGDASDTTRQTLARAETPNNLIALALGSPEFQRR